jgi:Asp-tRNA(Asn)/Glu-tRNA(Gln) amidotransferase A subunit family amidase
VPQPGPATLQARLSTLGPLARTVRDLELSFGVLAGAPPGRVDELPPTAWCEGDGSLPVRDDLVAVVERAAAVVGAERARPAGLERANDVYSRLRSLDGLVEVRALAAGREAELSETMRDLLAATREGTPAELAALRAEREALRDDLLAFLEERPVLLLPVSPVPAYDPAAPGHDLTQWEVLTTCRAISLFGVPAAAVTFGASSDGLPVAVQVVGRPGREGEVLAVARALEAAR